MASKLKYEDIKLEIEKSGWILISTAYQNLKTDLQLQCPNGHDNFVSFGKFRGGSYECPICKQNKYYKVDSVVQKKKGYRILGLDQASITSGWAIFDDGELIKYGAHTTDGRDSVERIAKTKYWIASMVEHFQPDEIILEDIQLQKFGQGEEAVLTYKKLAQLQGVLCNYFYEENYNYKIVSPSTWRALSQIKGKTRTDKKKNAQLKIKEKYDVNVTQDEADAILIAAWGVENHKKSEIITF